MAASESDRTESDRTELSDGVEASGGMDASGGGEASGREVVAGSSDGEVRVGDMVSDAQTVISTGQGSSVPSQPLGGGSPAEVTRVLLGHRLDHFELQTLIGGGGMGAVFRARDTRLDRTVAIKVIPRVGDDPELQRRFRNEAQSAARLDHPNIARVYDVGRQGGWHYIVFEYIEGTNLRDLVERDGVLSVDDAVFYTRQVTEALEHASRRGVTHRDIKPSNVLITPAGQVKLVDMGLARAQQLEVTDDMTASGVTLGTFDYISPEQAKDPRDADVRSDIYSLGCTLYFALTGRPPYGGGTVLQKLLSHGSAPLPDPRGLRGGVSDNLVAVLHKMLAKQPGDRYRRPADLIADLYQLAKREHLPRSLSAGAITVVPESRAAQLVERHLPWVVASVLVLLSVAWLQLVSSATGDLELSETIPAQAVVATPDDSERVVEAEAAEPAVEPSGPGGEATGSGGAGGSGASGRTESGPEVSDEPAVSPMSDLAIPAGPPEVLGSDSDGRQDAADGLGADRSEDGAAVDSEGGAGVVRVAGIGSEAALLPATPGERVVSSLALALEVAAEDADVGVIEIGPGVVRSGPVRWPGRDLTLRGATPESVLELESVDRQVGRERPVVDRTSAGTSGAGGSADEMGAMIQMGSASLQIDELNVVWRVRESIGGRGALFQLDGGNTVRLSDSTVTIASRAGRGAPVVEREVAVFGCPWRAVGPLSEAAGAPNPPLVAVQLSDVIVRGEASLVRLAQATLLELRWDNGLLAITGPMIDTGAASRLLPTGRVPMQLVLNDLTAVTEGGLVRVGESSVSESQPMLIDREANRCVFSVPGPGALLRLGPFSPGQILVFRGSNNYYDATSAGMQLVWEPSGSEDEEVERLYLNQLLGAERPAWFQESTPPKVVVWRDQQEPPSTRFQADPRDYRQDGVIRRGFDVSRLPRPPYLDGVESGE